MSIENAIVVQLRGVAQLGLERLVWVQEVVGSNPIAPIRMSDGFYVYVLRSEVTGSLLRRLRRGAELCRQ